MKSSQPAFHTVLAPLLWNYLLLRRDTGTGKAGGVDFVCNVADLAIVVKAEAIILSESVKQVTISVGQHNVPYVEQDEIPGNVTVC